MYISYFKKFLFGKYIYGVNIFIYDDNSIESSYVLLKIEKNVFKLEQSNYYNIQELPELFSVLNNKIPIVLSIDGKGIIHKKIEKDKNIKNLFLGLNLNDFYVQNINFDSNFQYISIIKTTKLSEIINSFVRKNYYVIGLELGPFSIRHFIRYLTNDESNVIQIPNYKVITQDQKVEIFEKNNELTTNEFDFENLKIPANCIIPFYLTLSYILKLTDFSNNPFSNINNFIWYKTYKKLLNSFIFLLIILVLIISVMLIFINFKKENYTLLVNEYEYLKQQNDSIRDKIKISEAIINKLNLIDRKINSYLISNICKSLPDDVTFLNFSFYPIINKNINENEKLTFEENIIKITGKTTNNFKFTEWTNTLKKETFIKEVKLEHLLKENNNVYNFKIIIYLR